MFLLGPIISCSCSWITKRLVRQKYCENVGRELTHEEKLDVNRLVQNFIDRLVHEQKVVECSRFITLYVMDQVMSKLCYKEAILQRNYIIPFLSHDFESLIEIMPCNKIDKPLVVYRFLGSVMTSISTLCTY